MTSSKLVHLAIGVDAEERRLVFASVVVEPKVTAGSPEPAPEPRGAAKGDAEDATSAEVGVLGKGDADVQKDLFDAGDGELRLDLGRRSRDFVNRLQNRGP